MVCQGFLRLANSFFIVGNNFMGPLVIDIGEAEALAILAAGVFVACAAAAEAILGRLDTGAQQHLVYEAEVCRDDSFIDIVDDGDGDEIVGVEGAQLTPVAIVVGHARLPMQELELGTSHVLESSG